MGSFLSVRFWFRRDLSDFLGEFASSGFLQGAGVGFIRGSLPDSPGGFIQLLGEPCVLLRGPKPGRTGENFYDSIGDRLGLPSLKTMQFV